MWRFLATPDLKLVLATMAVSTQQEPAWDTDEPGLFFWLTLWESKIAMRKPPYKWPFTGENYSKGAIDRTETRLNCRIRLTKRMDTTIVRRMCMRLFQYPNPWFWGPRFQETPYMAHSDSPMNRTDLPQNCLKPQKEFSRLHGPKQL